MGTRRQLLAIGSALVACLVLVAVAWAASSGVGQLATGERPLHLNFATEGPTPPTGTITASPVPSSTQTSTGPDLTWLGGILTFLTMFVIVALLGALLWLVAPRRLRWRVPRRLARVDFEDPRVTAKLEETLVSTRDVHLARLSQGSARNGIVQCWMSLEEAATLVGLPPRSAETPTEFLTRLLDQLQVDPTPGVRLAGLYHVARFSSHPVTEADRDAARRALVELHAQLRSRRGSENSEVGS